MTVKFCHMGAETRQKPPSTCFSSGKKGHEDTGSIPFTWLWKGSYSMMPAEHSFLVFDYQLLGCLVTAVMMMTLSWSGFLVPVSVTGVVPDLLIFT